MPTKMCPFRVIAYPSDPAEAVCVREDCQLWVGIPDGYNHISFDCAFTMIIKGVMMGSKR